MSDERLHYLRWAELSGLLTALAKAPAHEKHLVMDDKEIEEAASALMQSVEREMRG